ncbi:MAG: CD0415/CD1112 family protein [Clostridia bacterium]
MDWITDAINDWIAGLLIPMIMSTLGEVFTTVNTEIDNAQSIIGLTPQAFNGDVFNMIKTISDNVILPIAGMILTFVMCYELIHMVIEKNNMNDLPTSDIFKWIFKTFVAVLLVSNTFPIIIGIFDVSQSVVSQASGILGGTTNVTEELLDSLQAELETMDAGALMLVFLQAFLQKIVLMVASVCIFIVVYSRMLEIYLMTSMGAIPLATMTNKEWNLGQNYIKAMCALAFQGFLIIICLAIYSILLTSIVSSDDVLNAIWQCMMCSVLLCVMLFKTGSISKSIWTAH